MEKSGEQTEFSTIQRLEQWAVKFNMANIRCPILEFNFPYTGRRKEKVPGFNPTRDWRCSHGMGPAGVKHSLGPLF